MTTRPKVYLGRKTRSEPCACLNCGDLLDVAIGVNNRRKPMPGAISLCLRCGHLQAYDANLRFRPLTDEEMVDIAGDERLIAVQKARALLKL